MSSVIMWFRQDLRLADNPALFEAAQAGDVIPLYILDTDPKNDWPHGSASKWWLHHSLTSLMEAGVPLLFCRGKPLEVLQEVMAETQSEAIYWNRCYEPSAIQRDKEIKGTLGNVQTFNGSLLFEPWTVKTKMDSYYKVFTPFWKACLQNPVPRPCLPKAEVTYAKQNMEGLTLEELKLLPEKPNWAKGFSKFWTPGEAHAQQRLSHFLKENLANYRKGRDHPALEVTSKLSPSLHFGEISPHQIWETVQRICDPSDSSTLHFLSELGWREFSYHLLYHFPDLPSHPFQSKFVNFPWEENTELLSAWKKGLTGYPLVDAGMRELWASGYMHNRVRMIVASFLTKNCLLPWQEGASWFWDTLVDADLANNAASWQWVAGCGADAAPFFRIFNPITQSQKFDTDGTYIRKWVPEIRRFSNKDIHAPWLCSTGTQKEAGCLIGKDYPAPNLDLKQSRERALEAYRTL